MGYSEMECSSRGAPSQGWGWEKPESCPGHTFKEALLSGLSKYWVGLRKEWPLLPHPTPGPVQASSPP